MMIDMKSFFAALLMAVLLIAPTTSFSTEAGEKLVAKVGNITISEKQYQRELQKLLPMEVGFHGGMKPEKLEKVKKEALQNLIEIAYKFQYALREEISVDSQKFNDAWSAYEKKLDRRRLPKQELAQIRAEFYQKYLAKKAEEVAVDSKIVVTDEQIKNHFENNRERFKQPRRYTASHIFLKVDPSALSQDKAKKKKLADDLYARAVAGEDFYNLAYYNSDDRSRYVGGSLGQFQAGQTVREFDQALSKMNVGDISEPIQTIYGFHIIKLDAVEEARLLTYDEVANMMRQQYSDMQRKSIYQSWMAEMEKAFPLELYMSE